MIFNFHRFVGRGYSFFRVLLFYYVSLFLFVCVLFFLYSFELHCSQDECGSEMHVACFYCVIKWGRRQNHTVHAGNATLCTFHMRSHNCTNAPCITIRIPENTHNKRIDSKWCDDDLMIYQNGKTTHHNLYLYRLLRVFYEYCGIGFVRHHDSLSDWDFLWCTNDCEKSL